MSLNASCNASRTKASKPFLPRSQKLIKFEESQKMMNCDVSVFREPDFFSLEPKNKCFKRSSTIFFFFKTGSLLMNRRKPISFFFALFCSKLTTNNNLLIFRPVEVEWVRRKRVQSAGLSSLGFEACWDLFYKNLFREEYEKSRFLLHLY